MSDVRFTAKMHGASEVARLLRRYPQKVSRTLESLVKQEARGMAVELARATRPFGFSQAAKRRGEKAVAKDINTVFASPSDVFEDMRLLDPDNANRFWANVTNRRFARARKNLQESNSPMKMLPLGKLDPNLHRASRTGPYANVQRRGPAQVVTSNKQVDTYVTKVAKRVGFAKASWLNAAKAIGGRVRGAAQWASRHKTAPGTAIVKKGDSPSVTLINSLDYIEQACPTSSTERALEHAAGRLRIALSRALTAISTRTNAALRRRAS